MKKIAVFDFDGTISNSFPWFISRINHVANMLHFNKIEKNDVEKLRSMSTDQILKYLGISSFKLPFVIIYMKWLMNKEALQVNLFPEVSSLFKKLQRCDIKIIILSSNSEYNVKKILSHNGQYIEGFYCGAGLKSKEKHFKKIRQAYPNAMLISIGDEPRDEEAARKIGIKHLNVSWGYSSFEAFKGIELIDTFKLLEIRILSYFDIKS